MKEKLCFEDICGCTVESCPITYSMSMIGGKWRPIIIMRISQKINRRMFFEWISDNVYGHKKSRGGLGRFQKLITTRRDPIRMGRFCQCVKLL